MIVRKVVNASKFLLTKEGVFYAGSQAAKLASNGRLSRKTIAHQLSWRHMPGQYGLVIFDEYRNEVIMVRDHFGCQPLYYYCDEFSFVFGQNLPDIIACLPGGVEENPSALFRLYRFKKMYSDDTFYKNIYRVEPGSILRINARGQKSKQIFWQLDPESPDLVLKSDAAYLDRFEELINESVGFNAGGRADELAGELSGGLDSGSILLTANGQGLKYPLFMHVAPIVSERTDDYYYAKLLLDRLGRDNVSFIDASEFNVQKAIEHCAKIFAGFTPHIFYVLTQNISLAVAKSSRSVLLSGAGGDECVSCHAFKKEYLASIRQRQGLLACWQALHQRKMTKLKFLLDSAKYMHPWFYTSISLIEFLAKLKKDLGRYGACLFDRAHQKTHYPRTVRQEEWYVLQGMASYSIRTRIEYSAVLANSMGYEYRYPLLYPALVEFCFKLPLEQKRRDGVGRYLIRQYLKRHNAPADLYLHNNKAGGIFPATRDKTEGALKPLTAYNHQHEMVKRYGSRWLQRSVHQQFSATLHAKVYDEYQKACIADASAQV